MPVWGVVDPSRTTRNVRGAMRSAGPVDISLRNPSPQTGKTPLRRVFLHWLPHERATAGRNGYVFGGALYLQGATITRIVWPNHTTALLVDRHDLAYQVGYGWEWAVAHIRSGLELSTGGNQAGPVVLVKASLLWSPTRR